MRLPNCPHCGSSDPRLGGSRYGGGRYGGSFSQSSVTCNGCSAMVSLLSMGRESLAAFFREEDLEENPHGEKGTPETFHIWANQVLIPTWRHRQEAVLNHGHKEWCQWLKEVFYVQFPELYEEDSRGTYKKFSDETISYSECPPEAKKLVDDQWGYHHTPKGVGSYVPIPESLQAPVYPPKAPDFAMFSSNREGGWDRVDPAVSADIEPPEDPILRKNRELFNQVFTALESKVRQNIERRHVPNQYGGIEPWYTFQVEGCTFTVGWRKRVIAIHVETGKGIPTEDIRELALVQDKVTYQAFGAPRIRTCSELEDLLREERLSEDLVQRIVEDSIKKHPEGEIIRDGGWQDTRDVAYKLEVHAWGKNKLIEYLTVLCRTAILAAAAPSPALDLDGR